MIYLFIISVLSLISTLISAACLYKFHRDRARETNMNLLVDHIDQAAFCCNEVGRIELVNNYGERILGLKKGSLLPSIFIPPEAKEELFHNEYLARGNALTFRVETTRSFLVRLEPKTAIGGRVLGFYGLIRDITEEEKTKYYQERYQKQSGLAFLGSIFESLAHEIRTPCLAAEACFNMIQEDIIPQLEDGGSLDAESLESLRKYCRNGSRTTSQISDLLNHSRSFRRGYREGELGDIELSEACTYCKETIEAAYNTIISGHIEITTDGSGPFIVRGYLNRFLEALGNILKNSVESIIQKSRDVPELIPNIEIHIKSESMPERLDLDDIITIEIIDNGLGFDETTKDQIGTALFSTKTRDPSFKGTGLGLTLTIQTINAMGGTWDIENIYYRDQVDGSRTVIKIPLPQQIRSN